MGKFKNFLRNGLPTVQTKCKLTLDTSRARAAKLLDHLAEINFFLEAFLKWGVIHEYQIKTLGSGSIKWGTWLHIVDIDQCSFTAKWNSVFRRLVFSSSAQFLTIYFSIVRARGER